MPSSIRYRSARASSKVGKSQNIFPTSYVERSNLTFRMQNRRFTRLTNGFSKKLENHAYSVALFVMFYNFCRIHKTLRITPAMAAGVTERLWEVADIVAVVEAIEEPTKKRGSYKKQRDAAWRQL
jgi:hypothetical protein